MLSYLRTIFFSISGIRASFFIRPEMKVNFNNGLTQSRKVVKKLELSLCKTSLGQHRKPRHVLCYTYDHIWKLPTSYFKFARTRSHLKWTEQKLSWYRIFHRKTCHTRFGSPSRIPDHTFPHWQLNSFENIWEHGLWSILSRNGRRKRCHTQCGTFYPEKMEISKIFGPNFVDKSCYFWPIS